MAHGAATLAAIIAARFEQPILGLGDCMFDAVAHQLCYRNVGVPGAVCNRPLVDVTGTVLRDVFCVWVENNLATLLPFFHDEVSLRSSLSLMRQPGAFSDPLADHVHECLAHVLDINIFVEDTVTGRDFVYSPSERVRFTATLHADARFQQRTIGIIRKPMHYDALVGAAAHVVLEHDASVMPPLASPGGPFPPHRPGLPPASRADGPVKKGKGAAKADSVATLLLQDLHGTGQATAKTAVHSIVSTGSDSACCFLLSSDLDILTAEQLAERFANFARADKVQIRHQSHGDDASLLTQALQLQRSASGAQQPMFIECSEVGSQYSTVRVWRFPAGLRPTAFDTGKMKSTAQQRQPGTSIKDTPLRYQLLPESVNTVFVIGSNGSGKSMLLTRWQMELGKRMLYVAPSKVIAKRDTSGTYGAQDKHHPVPMPADDQTALKTLEGRAKEFKKIADAFTRVVGPRWTVEQNDSVPDGVVFLRSDIDSSNVVPLLYEGISDGLRQIFHVLLQAYHLNLSNYNVLVLDEPEAHLHPALYTRLCDELLQRIQQSEGNTRLVMATHDFHLVQSIAARPSVRALVMEVSSKCAYPRLKLQANVIYGKATAQGANDQTSQALYSDIHVQCTTRHPFARSLSGSLSVQFSPELLLDMTTYTPLVLLVEGEPDGPEMLLYQLLFDRAKLEIRPAMPYGHEKGGTYGCTEVRDKMLAARKGAALFQGAQPIKYYGLCDMDRSSVSHAADPNVAVLPVGELENLFWAAPMWSHYPSLLRLFTRKSLAEVNAMLSKAKDKFWQRFRETVAKYSAKYLSEYAFAAFDETAQQQRWPSVGAGSPADASKCSDYLQQLLNKVTSATEPWIAALQAKPGKQAEGALSSQVVNSALTRASAVKKHMLALGQLPIGRSMNTPVLKWFTNYAAYGTGVLQQRDASSVAWVLARLSDVTNEESDSFLRFGHLLNEKIVCDLLGDTVFGTVYLDHTPKGAAFGRHRVFAIFTRTLQLAGFGPNDLELAKQVRKEILATLQDIMFCSKFPSAQGSEDMLKDITNAFTQG